MQSGSSWLMELSRYPGLLLTRLQDGAEATWSANRWLGKGFIDHVEAVGGNVTLLDKEKFHQIFDNLYLGRVKYFPRVRFSSQSQREMQSLDVAARFEFRSQYKEHLANLKLFARAIMNGKQPDNLAKLPAHLAAVWHVALPLIVRYLRSKRAFNPTDAGIDFVLMSEQMPIQESSIKLTDQLNALGAPQIDVKWTIDGRELHTMAAFAERTKASFEERGLAKILIDEKLVDRDEAFLDGASDYYHQMGGARIGATSSNGVVDANLKVHGTNNLYVCGAAVYPFSGFGNPTYTAMALGLRLSDYLVEEKS